MFTLPNHSWALCTIRHSSLWMVSDSLGCVLWCHNIINTYFSLRNQLLSTWDTEQFPKAKSLSFVIHNKLTYEFMLMRRVLESPRGWMCGCQGNQECDWKLGASRMWEGAGAWANHQPVMTESHRPALGGLHRCLMRWGPELLHPQHRLCLLSGVSRELRYLRHSPWLSIYVWSSGHLTVSSNTACGNPVSSESTWLLWASSIRIQPKKEVKRLMSVAKKNRSWGNLGT